MTTALIQQTIVALMVAIHAVESHCGRDAAAGGNEYQITSVCVRDVNRIYSTRYRYPEDVRDNETAADIVMLYLTYYGMQYFHDYGKLPTKEVLAKIYNCGYTGFRRGDRRGAEYWRKVNAEIDKGKGKRK